ARGSWAVSYLEYLRHAEVFAAALGRVGERLVLRQARAILVVAHHVDHGHGVRGRLDAGCVEGAQRVDVGQDAAELLAHALELGVAQRQARETRDVLDVLPGDHPRAPPDSRTGATGACGRRWRTRP